MPRTDLTFDSHGVQCAAWQYEPAGDGPHPIVVMGHGFSATRDLRLDAYAERFEQAGLGALVFDYRTFGDSGGEPRQVLDIAKQLEDWRAAIATARGLPWVDASRVALFGSSFSGGHVVALAAADHDIAAIVAQCPFQDGLATLPMLGVKNNLRLAAHGIYDQVGALLGRPPHYVPAVAEPGGLAIMATSDSKAGFEAMMPARTTWENRVAARIALRVGLYRPGAKAAQVRCPALWCITDGDTLVPADNTAKHAAKAPRGEIRRYPIGHFEIYLGEHFERAVADQTEFLVRHLQPQRSAAPPPAVTPPPATSR